MIVAHLPLLSFFSSFNDSGGFNDLCPYGLVVGEYRRLPLVEEDRLKWAVEYQVCNSRVLICSPISSFLFRIAVVEFSLFFLPSPLSFFRATIIAYLESLKLANSSSLLVLM